MQVIENLKYGPFGPNYLDAYLPEQEKFDMVIWFHGGGLENGSRKKPELAAAVVAQGLAFVSVEYRMYPDAKFPDYIKDAAAAIAFVQNSAALSGRVDRLFVSGQSAGAYLTMMLFLCPSYLKNAGVLPQSISGFIADSAQQTTHYNILREQGLDTRLERITEAAPLYYVNGDLNINHLLILYYKEDMPCRPEQNKLMYQSLKRFLPKADIRLQELAGTHCSGSSKKEADGSYRYVTQLVEFVNSLGRQK